MMKKLTLMLCALLIVVAGAGCSPEELRKDVVETQAGAAGETAPGTSAGAAAPVLTQKEADAVLALAASKSEAVNRPEDVTPEAIAKLENTVITSDYVANFGRFNATILADESLPAEALAIAVLKILESEAVGKSSLAGDTMTIPNPEDTVLEKTDVVFKYSGGKWLIDNVIFTNK
ncbi:MAG: hypothetical protein WAS02_04645 [Propionicimonas sp.]